MELTDEDVFYLTPQYWPEGLDTIQRSYPGMAVGLAMQLFHDIRCHHLCVETEGRIVGVMSYYRHRKPIDDSSFTLEIVLLAVHPRYRGLGIGRLLVGQLFRRLRGNARRIVTDVQVDDSSAQAFLKRMGFRRTRDLDGWSHFACRPEMDLPKPARPLGFVAKFLGRLV